MIFVFLVDTSVSMEQELDTGAATAGAAGESESGSNSTLQKKGTEERIFGTGAGAGTDTSGRVNRRWQRKSVRAGARGAQQRCTRLDCARNVVEQIVSNRQGFDQDRYMLVTYAGSSGSGTIRSGLKDSRATLLAELGRLTASDRFQGGVALASVFSQLSLMRAAYDIDTYGYGRYPTLSDGVQIVWLTDGAPVVTEHGVQNKLHLPVNNTLWAETYAEPFRWDQRLTLVLLHAAGDARLCGAGGSEATLQPMCSVMGGTVHHVGSLHQAQRFVEGFAPARAGAAPGRPAAATALVPGVLVNFERIDDNPANPRNADMRVLLHAQPCSVAAAPLPAAPAGEAGSSAGMAALVAGQLGYFPIPEAFWPETAAAAAAPAAPAAPAAAVPGGGQPAVVRRSAHPTLGYSQAGVEWAVPPQFPFDKYQIDGGSNVAQKLLAATAAAQAAHEAGGGKGAARPVCWPVFVHGSYATPKNSGFPFGLLRANAARTSVNLYVLPYNYAALWKILAKLDAAGAGGRVAVAQTPAWRREFDEYLQHTPGYYAIPLKRALNLFGVPHAVVPRTFGQGAGMRALAQYAGRVHAAARREWERLAAAGLAGDASLGRAAGLQQALLAFSPAADVSHLAANAFDVDRAHCLATLSAMRRVFVRECMAAQGAYFRANSVVPPPAASPAMSPAEARMDVDDDSDGDGDRGVPSSPSPSPSPYTPPVASMEYAQYGRAAAAAAAAGGAPQSPLGGPVDVASEDDRDTRHSVAIRSMGAFGAAMGRLKQQQARDPLQDERLALQQRRNMFGNPYRRPVREPRGAENNVLARSPELSGALGLTARASPAAAPSSPMQAAAAALSAQQQQSAQQQSAQPPPLEIEGEAEVNELAIDKMIDDLPMQPGDDVAGGERAPRDAEGDADSAAAGPGRFWWLQRRDVPRRRSINAPWRKDDRSWNVNPWAARLPGDVVPEPGSVTYTADAAILHKGPASVTRIDAHHQAQQLQLQLQQPQLLPLAPALSSDSPAERVPTPPPVSPTLSPPAAAAPASAAPRRINVAEERAWFLKAIKADPAHYDEAAILRRLADLQATAAPGSPQLNVIVAAATTAAKAMRRKQLVARLEERPFLNTQDA
ncbi:hypothetical protein LPJ53_000795 [Coemansia erecta]|uniref:FHA domain-containing protein n=1 Tax=Coemansia erecta TaxID=147472 RepID=A0A9W8CUS9_9FUNG|nr:hypothetical protein LPJ53_000795 [Coemansia erecta]